MNAPLSNASGFALRPVTCRGPGRLESFDRSATVALRKVVAGHIPYLYTPVYEGGERTPGVMAIGETPGAQWRPAIEWLANTRQASNWYLIGSDYVWPWLSHKSIKKYIADAGGSGSGPPSPTWF